MLWRWFVLVPLAGLQAVGYDLLRMAQAARAATMNFPRLVGSELEPMLRRILLAVLVVALTAGFVLPAAAQGAMDCEQVSLQAPAGGCGGEAMAGTACVLACHAGACITPSLARTESDVNVTELFPRCTVVDSDGARAPDTAPPKHFIA
jgi:hypothetical protein